MSENAPSLAIADRYKDGRPGRAEVQTDLPLTSINPEVMVDEQPTAGQFVDALTILQKSREANPHVTFDAENFLINPEEGSDEAVYAKVLERVHGTTEPLLPHEIRVLAHIQREALLEQAAAQVGKDTLEDPKEFYGAAKQALMTMQESLKTPQSDDEIQARLKQIHAVMQTMNEPSSDATQGKSLLAQYVEVAQLQNSTPSDENATALAEAEKALASDEARINNRAFTYGLIAGNAATPETQPAEQAPAAPEDQKPVEKSPELIEAEQKLSALRTQLATLNAKREKRFWGSDAWRGDAGYSPTTKQLYEDYRKASQEVFKLENKGLLEDPTIDGTEKIKQIAQYTVAEGRKFDEAILDNYKNKNTWLGKKLEQWGKLDRKTKLAAGVLIGLGGVGISLATGGTAAFLVTGASLYTNLEAKRRQKRASGANMLDLDADTMANARLQRYKEAGIDVNDSDFTRDIDSMFTEVKQKTEERIDKEQVRRGMRALGSFAAAAATGAIMHGIHDGSLFGSDHAGAATPSGHEALGGADPSSHVAQAPLSPDALHNIYTGPSSININPGDGYFKVFEQMNIPQDQWNSVLGKVSNSLVQHGDAYWMPDGTAGISAPGQMSQFAFDAIKQAANLR